MFDLDKIDQCFPKKSYRPQQRECIEYIVNQFNSDKKTVVLECPTGSGKSAIAMTIANMVSSSYYLTSSKQLQDQLLDDYDDIVVLKGRNAYPCTYWSRRYSILRDRKMMTSNELATIISQNPTCDNGYCKRGLRGDEHTGKASCKQCFTSNGQLPGELTELPLGMTHSACPYFEKLFDAVKARKVVMNFNNFVAQTSIQRFGVRDLLIIDEAHNQESILMDLVSATLSDYRLKKFNIKIPEYDTVAKYIKWVNDNKIRDLLVTVCEELKCSGVSTYNEIDSITNMIKSYDSVINKIDNNTYGDEWIVQYEDLGTYRKVIFKPVYVQNYANDILYKYANKVLMLSATILDGNVFCNSLGIERYDAALKRIGNNFPVENRLIHFDPVCKLTGGKTQSAVWMPKVIKKVNELVRKYKGKKGIIHTHNFAIHKALLEGCDSDVRCRFLDQNNFSDKTDMLAYHAKCDDTVIVAPAMHEGLDLKDDLSRFQIIAKIPYPNFYSDKQLARRKELDPKYYDWLTALKLVQSVGRSIRSNTDYADTYIIDESFKDVMKYNSSMFPKWFKEAIRGL
jgi:Rad3-related DNA helicase